MSLAHCYLTSLETCLQGRAYVCCSPCCIFLIAQELPWEPLQGIESFNRIKMGTSLSTDLREFQFTLFSACVLVFEAEKQLKRL